MAAITDASKYGNSYYAMSGDSTLSVCVSGYEKDDIVCLHPKTNITINCCYGDACNNNNNNNCTGFGSYTNKDGTSASFEITSKKTE